MRCCVGSGGPPLAVVIVVVSSSGIRGGILTGIDSSIIHRLDEPVDKRRQQRAQNRSQPVDPMLADEMARDHCRPKRACRVEARAGVVYTSVCYVLIAMKTKIEGE